MYSRTMKPPSSGVISGTSRCHGCHELVNLDDARMVERRQPLGLLRQRHQALAAERVFGAGDLDGHVAAVLLVMCQEDQEVPLAQQPAGPKSADSLGNDHLRRPARHIRIPRSFAKGRGVGNGRRVGFGRLVQEPISVRVMGRSRVSPRGRDC